MATAPLIDSPPGVVTVNLNESEGITANLILPSGDAVWKVFTLVEAMLPLNNVQHIRAVGTNNLMI